MDTLNIALFAGVILERNTTVTARDVQDFISNDQSVGKVISLVDISKVMNLLVQASYLEVRSSGEGTSETFARFIPECVRREIIKENKLRRNDRRNEDRYVENGAGFDGIMIPPSPHSVYGNGGGGVPASVEILQ